MRGLLVSTAALAAVFMPLAAAGQEAPPPVSSSVLTWTFEQQKANYPAMEKVAAHKVVKRGASVFPLPVLPRPRTSRPASVSGRV